MVRTRGGSRLRPRVRSVHLSERPQPQLRSRPQYHHRSPRQYLRSLRDFVDTRNEWDPGPHRLCLRGDLGGPGPPSGLAHRAQASHLPLGLSHHQSHRLQTRHHHLSYRLPLESGGRYSYGTPFRGMHGSIAERSFRSRTTMSQR